MKNRNTKQVVGVGLFTAIVVVLQLLGSFIKLGPFSISLVLVPIVVGAALYGYKAGAWLGFVFGLAVLLSGDAALFMTINVPGTLITVLAKGTLAGLLSGLCYKLVEKFNPTLAVTVSAVVCPIVNTGVFLLGCVVFFMDTIEGWAAASGYASAGADLVVAMVGFNFLLELLANILLGPVIVRLIGLGKKN